MDDNESEVIVCEGPPKCLLEGDEAIACQQAGCKLCKRITIYYDRTETIVVPIWQ